MKRLLVFILVAVVSLPAWGWGRKKVEEASLFPFDTISHTAFHTSNKGHYSLTGQAFLRQQGGGIVTCAGSPVLLLPDTIFFQKLISEGKRGAKISSIDARAKDYVRVSQCNAQGNFEFKDVPSGIYFVTTEVSWKIGYNYQGGVLLKKIELANNFHHEVLLTEYEFISR